jgi:hypothetical protein
MISKQKIYMLASCFFLALTMVVYAYNGIIIPKKLDVCRKNIYMEMQDKYSSVFAVTAESIAKGVYIDESNYSGFLSQGDMYSEKNLAAVTYTDIENGFYLARDMEQNEILTSSDILSEIKEKNCSLYEIRICNSFCGDLRPGEYVDLIYITGGRIMTIAQSRQLKGVYGRSGDRYVEAGKMQSGSEAVIFLELTDREYEDYLFNADIYVRKSGDTFGN